MNILSLPEVGEAEVRCLAVAVLADLKHPQVTQLQQDQPLQ